MVTAQGAAVRSIDCILELTANCSSSFHFITDNFLAVGLSRRHNVMARFTRCPQC